MGDDGQTLVASAAVPTQYSSERSWKVSWGTSRGTVTAMLPRSLHDPLSRRQFCTHAVVEKTLSATDVEVSAMKMLRSTNAQYRRSREHSNNCKSVLHCPLAAAFSELTTAGI